MARRRKHRKARADDRLRDSGPDASGNYGVNPYAARGHDVEVAPKELRSNAASEQFPKRITTQRAVDRYLARGYITRAEWQAANALWSLWCEAELEARVTSGYDPVMVQSSPNMDGRIAKRLDGAVRFLALMRAVPYRSRGIVHAVVIQDWTVTDWDHLARRQSGDSTNHAFARLRSGLSAIAVDLGY